MTTAEKIKEVLSSHLTDSLKIELIEYLAQKQLQEDMVYSEILGHAHRMIEDDKKLVRIREII